MKKALLIFLLLPALAGCSKSGSKSGMSFLSASPQLKRETLRARVEHLESTVHGEPLLRKSTVDSLYDARGGEPAWTLPKEAQSVRDAILAIAQDGLEPADYHLSAIDTLLAERRDHRTEEGDADLELLLSDAVAAMIDDVRYGKVSPKELDPHWNVDPRKDAPPLVAAVERVADAPDPKGAIEKEKLDHFIYKGLKAELARLTDAQKAGGWPTIAGGPITPGKSDPRIMLVRSRLAATGELANAQAADSSVYDDSLQQAIRLFQERHRLNSSKAIDKATLAELNVPVEQRVEEVRVNLERARWVLPGLGPDFLLVNLPAFKTYLIQGGQKTWESRIQVGKEGRKTPIFRANMKYAIFNPTWTVPSTILKEDIIGSDKGAASAIAEKHLHVLDRDGNEVDPSSVDWSNGGGGYTLRQDAGEKNALGRVKFMFPNPYDVYLHDTPHRELFAADKRTFSSGCMRLENPMELAKIVFADKGFDDAKIDSIVATGKTTQVNLSKPLPVLIVYWTVSVGTSGEVRYNPDIYGLDDAVFAALRGREQT
jgi:murein L,D-transpeptidase YcbB/YkuD